MELTLEVRTAIQAHAELEYPNECCGLVVHDGQRLRYVPGRNLSTAPADQFRLDPRSWLAAEKVGNVRAVVHSHPDGGFAPSTADRAALDGGFVPWVVFSWPEGKFSVTYPSSRGAPYTGRQFIHGSQDCFTLLRDYYRRELGVSLPEVWHGYEWWQEGENLYLDHAATAGFQQVNSLQTHDVVLMRVAARVPNHVGIYVGDGRILHHLANQLSRHDTYGGIWQRATHGFYRYVGPR